jgi:hypothetical protein
LIQISSLPKMAIPIFRQTIFFDNASAKRGFQAKAYKVTTKLNLFHVAILLT